MKKKGDERKVKWKKKKKWKKRRKKSELNCLFLMVFLFIPFLLLRGDVSRDTSRRRRGKNDTIPPVELTLFSSQKVTVRRECGSRRCSHLSDLGSPDIGRGKKKEAKWLAGTPNGSGVPFPSGAVRKFLSKSRGRRTIAILLRAKDKRLTETRRTPKSFKPVY